MTFTKASLYILTILSIEIIHKFKEAELSFTWVLFPEIKTLLYSIKPR